MLQHNQSATGSPYQSQPVATSTYDPEVFLDDEELFTIRTANTWLQEASKRPVPKMLFGKLWYEGELCILFADSNLGKSILAVQIANAISTAESIAPFTCEADPQPVLYFDFELTEKQFEARYSEDYSGHYDFSNNFYRAEMNPDSDMPSGFSDFDEYLSACFERSIVQTGSKILVIDNLTYLRGENEKAKDALPLKDREVILFPDVNGYDKWRMKAREMNLRFPAARFRVDNTLERTANWYERQQGIDMADRWIDQLLYKF